MSDTVTVSGVSATIYGTYAAAVDYGALMYGAQYVAWTALAADDRKKTLVAATRYLDSQAWLDDYDTFAERDAVAAFPIASFALAVLILSDATLPQNADQASNIASLGAGSAQISFLNPTSVQAGTATKLPPILQRLVGEYLAAASASSAIAALGQSGDEDSAFGDCSDYDRGEPF